MRIGEVARRSGLRTSAIRYYERMRLLPEAVRTESGYREYDDSVLGRLAFVLAGRRLGLSLEDLRRIIDLRDHGESPCRHTLDLLEHQLEDLARRIDDLEGLRANLREVLARAAAVDPAHCPPERICSMIAAEGAGAAGLPAPPDGQ